MVAVDHPIRSTPVRASNPHQSPRVRNHSVAITQSGVTLKREVVGRLAVEKTVLQEVELCPHRNLQEMESEED